MCRMLIYPAQSPARRAHSSAYSWGWLNEKSREDALARWCAGVIVYPPQQEDDAYLESRVNAEALDQEQPTHTWLPNYRYAYRARLSNEALNQLQQRCALITATCSAAGWGMPSGEAYGGYILPSLPVMPGSGETMLLHALKPLLEVWYGRIVFLPQEPESATIDKETNKGGGVVPLPGYEFCLVDGATEQVKPSTNTGNHTIDPLPRELVWDAGYVIEMFGASTSNLCSCFLTETSNTHDQLGIEIDFLNALALALGHANGNVVVLDIDADYAEG